MYKECKIYKKELWTQESQLAILNWRKLILNNIVEYKYKRITPFLILAKFYCFTIQKKNVTIPHL